MPCFEGPARADFVEQALRARGHALRMPEVDSTPQLERIHTRRYLCFLRTAWDQWLALGAANADVPIWLGHGTQDEVVVLPRAEATRDALQSLGYTVQWHSYPMGHSVCMEEVTDLQRWLLQVLAV